MPFFNNMKIEYKKSPMTFPKSLENGIKKIQYNWKCRINLFQEMDFDLTIGWLSITLGGGRS